MTTIAISDTHGYLPSIDPADLLFICGDISPLDIQRNSPKMKDWLFNEFLTWVSYLPVDKVFLIAGNHDFYFEGISQVKIKEFENAFNGKLTYLCNEVTYYVDSDWKEWSIFGTPYCHVFGNWPFMRTEECMTEKFSEIPDKVDFIITHDTPYEVGLQDVILEGNYNKHIGNKPLRDRLEQIDFKWLFHGHIHSSNHTPEFFNTGHIVNVSLLNENYDPAYEPLELIHS